MRCEPENPADEVAEEHQDDQPKPRGHDQPHALEHAPGLVDLGLDGGLLRVSRCTLGGQPVHDGTGGRGGAVLAGDGGRLVAFGSETGHDAVVFHCSYSFEVEWGKPPFDVRIFLTAPSNESSASVRLMRPDVLLSC